MGRCVVGTTRRAQRQLVDNRRRISGTAEALPLVGREVICSRLEASEAGGVDVVGPSPVPGLRLMQHLPLPLQRVLPSASFQQLVLGPQPLPVAGGW